MKHWTDLVCSVQDLDWLPMFERALEGHQPLFPALLGCGPKMRFQSSRVNSKHLFFDTDCSGNSLTKEAPGRGMAP